MNENKVDLLKSIDDGLTNARRGLETSRKGRRLASLVRLSAKWLALFFAVASISPWFRVSSGGGTLPLFAALLLTALSIGFYFVGPAWAEQEMRHWDERIETWKERIEFWEGQKAFWEAWLDEYDAGEENDR